ncbi:flagellar basal body rod protein FlgF [Polynucleobacter sp. Nonnen-W13]|uniref:flagellar basal body rod protein FlgF n=1 Tax=Polynucleobacter sp. Nonnen-W13 TaxID=1855625 RepID=UPI001C0D8B78|nr:flagellar basal body rod protein FlgF [Polynucleobacter sp. Nonnen-W13]MBU3558502.1 flagellar basal body rod protein FlgF [Polynucleobacter sp. Nonnen-W13]
MINRYAYTSMTGATASTNQLAVTSNNLANSLTPGFREVISAFRAVPLKGDGEPFTGNGADTRVFSVETTPGSNFTGGQIQTTSNPLDAAIKGDGFFAVRRPDGKEAYTRAGKFMVNDQGVLSVGKEVPVVGEGGNITIPTGSTMQIAEDGAVYTQLPGTQYLNQVGKLKLVNPNTNDLVRADDGLFDLPGQQAASDPRVKVVQGAFELSNVNPTLAMVQMIGQSRLFDLNSRSITFADQNARSATTLLSLSRS